MVDIVSSRDPIYKIRERESLDSRESLRLTVIDESLHRGPWSLIGKC